MSESTDLACPFPTQAPQSRWRRHRKLWVTLAAVLAFLLWAFYFYLLADRGLDAAVAETDRLDPGWRMEDLEAARPSVPDEENSAPLVLQARGLLPIPLPPGVWNPTWPESLLEQFMLAHPAVQFDDDQVRHLRALLKLAQPVLPSARRLVDFTRGRYTVNWAPDSCSTDLPHLRHVSYIRRQLVLDAALRAQDRDLDGALASSMAALNTGRSIGDEPTLLSQSIRGQCQGAVVHSLERSLAQGEPGPAALQKLQRLVEDEADQPLMLIGARARRACLFLDLQAMRRRTFDRTLVGRRNPYGLPDSVMSLADSADARNCQANYLRYWNVYVEMAKLPPKERTARLKSLKRPPQALPSLLDSRIKDEDNLAAYRFLGWQAGLRCAVAAIAAERYRQAKRHWPSALADLVPEFLAKLPEDPFDGEPVRFRKVADGIEIYSVGLSGNRTSWETPAEVYLPAEGFRLWNVQRRRQPAPKRPEGTSKGKTP